MVRYKEIKQNKIAANHEIVKTVSRSRSEVQAMLNNHDNSQMQCLNLRRRINNEVEMEQKNQAKFPKHKEIDAENFLPQIEKWELRVQNVGAQDLFSEARIEQCDANAVRPLTGQVESCNVRSPS